jgi:CDP-diacylglycerol--glycerol-3-phosphate 3-phosphatidyltransferase/archaetidylinositol phosphate synthase
MLAKLRPLYNLFVEPLGKLSVALGLTPDAWTIFSLLASLVAGILLYQGNFWWGLALSIVMFLADVMDGATARAKGTPSKFGTIFDHVIDRYAEFFVIGGLATGGWISPLAAMFTASGVVMASYVRAKAESTGIVKDCTVGIAGRAEKLILTYGAIILFGLNIPNWAEYMLIAVGVISHITAVQRLLYSRAAMAQSG